MMLMFTRASTKNTNQFTGAISHGSSRGKKKTKRKNMKLFIDKATATESVKKNS